MKSLVFIPILCLVLAFTACDTSDFHQNVRQVKQVALLGVEINNASEGKEDSTRYPNINFVGETFRSNLIAEFNAQSPRVRLFLVTNLNPPGFGQSLRGKLLLDENKLFLRDNYQIARFSSNERTRLTEALKADAYAVLEGEASVWGQSLNAKLKVYDLSNRLIWNQSMKVVSTYIIKDENSPYISDYDELLNTLEKQRSHKTEILEVFAELGRNTAKSMNDRLNAFVRFFEKPVPKKIPPKTK